MPSFGEYLKRERELRELSLREISDETKISYRYLEAIEENNEAKLPAEVFVKGFVKSYANYIGLDPDEAILRYQEFKKTKDISRESQPAGMDQPAYSADRRKMDPVLWGLLALFMLAGLLVLGYGLFRWMGNSSKQETTGQIRIEKPAPAPAETGAQGTEAVPEVLNEPAADLSLTGQEAAPAEDSKSE